MVDEGYLQRARDGGRRAHRPAGVSRWRARRHRRHLSGERRGRTRDQRRRSRAHAPDANQSRGVDRDAEGRRRRPRSPPPTPGCRSPVVRAISARSRATICSRRRRRSATRRCCNIGKPCAGPSRASGCRPCWPPSRASMKSNSPRARRWSRGSGSMTPTRCSTRHIDGIRHGRRLTLAIANVGHDRRRVRACGDDVRRDA